MGSSATSMSRESLSSSWQKVPRTCAARGVHITCTRVHTHACALTLCHACRDDGLMLAHLVAESCMPRTLHPPVPGLRPIIKDPGLCPKIKAYCLYPAPPPGLALPRGVPYADVERYRQASRGGGARQVENGSSIISHRRHRCHCMHTHTYTRH